mgnify:CR=1 FL=1
MPKGSVIIRDKRTWHRGTKNISNKVRYMVGTSYSMNWYKLGNLKFEKDSPILMKYLTEKGFSQNLISKQEEVDNMLINYVQGELEKTERETEKIKFSNPWSISILKLYNLRRKINLISVSKPMTDACNV